MANISPNDLHDAAKRIMLEGRDPSSRRDWIMCVNFWASNVSFAEVEICKIMKVLYGCPLKDEEIQQIAEFQQDKKKIKEAKEEARQRTEEWKREQE